MWEKISVDAYIFLCMLQRKCASDHPSVHNPQSSCAPLRQHVKKKDMF